MSISSYVGICGKCKNIAVYGTDERRTVELLLFYFPFLSGYFFIPHEIYFSMVKLPSVRREIERWSQVCAGVQGKALEGFGLV